MTTPAPLGYCYDCCTGNCTHPECNAKPPRPRLAVTLRNGTSLCRSCAPRTDIRNQGLRNGGHMAGAA